MDLVRGPDLGVRLRDRGPLPPDEAARIGAEIADALGAAHRSGILHRDVKPQNILLEPGRPGAAHRLRRRAARGPGDDDADRGAGGHARLSRARSDGRRPRRRPRRRVRPGHDALPRADRPAPPPRVAASPTRRRKPTGHRPRAVRGDLPEWLDAIVARATRAEPARRFPSAGSMAEALRGKTGVGASSRPPAPPRSTSASCAARPRPRG